MCFSLIMDELSIFSLLATLLLQPYASPLLGNFMKNRFSALPFLTPMLSAIRPEPETYPTRSERACGSSGINALSLTCMWKPLLPEKYTRMSSFCMPRSPVRNSTSRFTSFFDPSMHLPHGIETLSAFLPPHAEQEYSFFSSGAGGEAW